jgi:hypothetical protein
MKKEITKEEALEWIAQMHMNKEFCREDIQEDIRAYMINKFSTGAWRTEIQTGEIFHWGDDLCKIVERNFKTMEDA